MKKLGEILAAAWQPIPTPAETPNPGKILGLSPRQSAVLECIHAGLKDSAIGAELKMSLGTVHAHTHVIFSKLRVDCRVQAALKWERATLTRLSRKGSQGAKTRKRVKLEAR